MNPLNQPIVSTTPEAGQLPNQVLDLKSFLALLHEEENYWAPEQNDTSLSITRLRKIFYDQWGWNSQLIRGASSIPSRYNTVMQDSPANYGRAVPRYVQLIYAPAYRVVTYTDHDRVYGNTRTGQVPLIYQSDHQAVRLPNGEMCDIGHVLAGLDALNHPQVVSPLPNFLSFLDKIFPHVDSNADVVTWLGDIASSSADFLFDYLRNKNTPISESDEQVVIDTDAPGSDMMGDIDPYVIAHHYDISTHTGQLVTDILHQYYTGDQDYYRHRFSTFSKIIGLKGWDGQNFSNEEAWIKAYHHNLRNSICFVAFSQNEKSIRGLLIPLQVWLNGYQDVLKMDMLMRIFIQSLKQSIIQE
ncbi:MAG: hypothetical protein JNJ58_10245 [Chitinophagaceae bacterium]|nr:hypothetical protein [Chitinophagaceae bacterium]